MIAAASIILPAHEERHREHVQPADGEPDVGSPGPTGRGLARVPRAGPRSQAQDELALADRAHFVALGGVEVDEARRRERPLAGSSADQQLAAQDEDERVLVDLVLLQALALGQQQRDHAVGALIGAKDLRMVRRDTQTV
jgi:hypothetical protein